MIQDLFKAKTLDTHKWVEGNLIQSKNVDNGYEAIIIPSSNNGMYTKGEDIGFESWYKVDPETICRYMGFDDKAGNKVWENDIAEIRIFYEIAEGYGKHEREKGVMCFDLMGMPAMLIGPDRHYSSKFLSMIADAELSGSNIDIQIFGNVIDDPEFEKSSTAMQSPFSSSETDLLEDENELE